MDHAGHAAFETLQAIEHRLMELARQWEPPTGRQVAIEILKAIYEARGEDPKEVDHTINRP